MLVGGRFPEQTRLSGQKPSLFPDWPVLAARVATNGPIRHDGAMGNQDSNSGSGDASILVRELTGDPALMRLTPGEVVTLGRAPSNRLVLHDERASRNHAELHQAADGGWLIRDLKSRNGTLVSGDAVTGDRLLIDGDVICIGAVEIQFFVGSPPVDATGTERDTDSGEGGITGEMPSGIEQWHSTIRYRRNRSRLLDDIRESAHTGHKVGQAAAELCRLAFALGRAEEIDAAANRALESAMLGSAAGRGMVLLPKPGTPSKRRILFTDLHGVAAVPSNLKVADVPADLIETVLATDEAILAGPETVAGQPPAITIIAPVRSDGRAIGCIYLSSEPAGGDGSPDDLEFVMAVCDAVGQAYNNLSTRETLSFRLANVATENRLLKERLGEETRMVGDNPNIDFDSSTAPDPLERMPFKHPQEFGLNCRAHLANFVEEECARVSRFEFTCLLFRRTGEGPFLMPKQFAFKQCLREGGAVEADVRACTAVTRLVDRTGDKLLASTAFPADEDGCLGSGDPFDLIADFAEGRALAYHPGFLTKPFLQQAIFGCNVGEPEGECFTR